LQQPIGEGELRSCGIQALVSKQAARDVGRWHSRSWNFDVGLEKFGSPSRWSKSRKSGSREAAMGRPFRYEATREAAMADVRQRVGE
jgi:hypothetical protein